MNFVLSPEDKKTPDMGSVGRVGDMLSLVGRSRREVWILFPVGWKTSGSMPLSREITRLDLVPPVTRHLEDMGGYQSFFFSIVSHAEQVLKICVLMADCLKSTRIYKLFPRPVSLNLIWV